MTIFKRVALAVMIITALTATIIAQNDTASPHQLDLTHFLLLDARNDQPLFEITEGAVIDLSALPIPADQLNIQAVEADPINDIDSVRFGINRNANINIENTSPYTLYRNNRGNYFAGQLQAGDYALTATPYTQNNARGVAGEPLVVRFRVIDGPEVRGFTLVNALDNTDLMTITDGATLDFEMLPVLPSQINIRADVTPSVVGSVLFALNGPVTRPWAENFAPYSLFGDDKGNYAAGTLLPGDYTLTATPFSGLDGQGRAGIPLMVAFNVVVTPPDEAPFVVATNPANGAQNIPLASSLTLQFSEPVTLATPVEDDFIQLSRQLVNTNVFELVCSLSGTRNLTNFAVNTVDQITYTLVPRVPFQRGDVCTGTVFAAGVRDVDNNDPPDNMLADYTFGFTAGDPPDVAPFVQQTNPANNATNISTDTSLTITFSEPVATTFGWLQLVCDVSGTRTQLDFVIRTINTISYTLQPRSPLSNGDTCTFTVFANFIKDRDLDDPPDTMLANYNFSFSTLPPPDEAPTVQSISVPDGATDVPVDTTIGITFTEPVAVNGNWFTLACSISGERDITAFAVETVDNITFTLTPQTLLARSDACMGTVIGAGVTDLDANDPPDTMPENVVFGFSAQAADAAPIVTALNPADGAVDVPANTTLQIGFSEAVTVADGWFSLQCELSGLRDLTAFTVATPDNILYTLTPLAVFTEGETCTGTVTAASVTDVDLDDPPDTLPADVSFSFTIANAPDAAPFVSSTTPGSGATGIGLTTAVTFTFSEPVNVTGNWTAINCEVSGTRLGPEELVITTADNITFTIAPIRPYAFGEVCTTGVAAARVTDVDADDPPDAMLEDFIYTFTTVFDPPPTVFNTSPADGAINVLPGADVLIAFSEPVNAPATAFTITCESGTRAFTLNTADNVVFTLNPTTNFGLGDTCTVRVIAAQVTDLDANDPADNMAADVTFTFTTRMQ